MTQYAPIAKTQKFTRLGVDERASPVTEPTTERSADKRKTCRRPAMIFPTAFSSAAKALTSGIELSVSWKPLM